MTTDEQEALPAELKAIVGDDNVITAPMAAKLYTVGTRLGDGKALAVVKPGTLHEAVAVLQACVAAGVAVVPQGANTGLTGGSVPRDELCDRPTVVLNMRRLQTIVPIEGGKRMLCLAGAGIYDLSQRAAAVGVESHSVLGSIFLNPSVAAGVAFGSGGTQVRKGPVYTERVLYCRVTADGRVEVVNSLGVGSSLDQATLFDKLESGSLDDADVDTACKALASDTTYAEQVCKLDGSVARFNADTTGPEPNRSEGKVLILASVHDTFAKPKHPEVLWVSCRDLETAQALKRDVLMRGASELPSSCEYMDKDAFDVVDGAGRVLCTALSWLGVGPRLSRLWSLKLRIESLPIPFADVVCDKVMYWVNGLFPRALPPPLVKLASRKDHHLLVALGDYDDDGAGTKARIRRRLDDFVASRPRGDVEIYACDAKDAAKVNFFRFAAAPAFRTWCVGTGSQGLSIDYALAKSETAAPTVGGSEMATPVKRMRYSHFACNVVHEDLAYAPGVDVHAQKMKIKKLVEARGGRLPAEHGHGTEYVAPPDTQARWRRTDPTNTLNPGVGGLPYTKGYE